MKRLRVIGWIVAASLISATASPALQTADAVLSGYSEKVVQRLYEKNLSLLPRPTDDSLYIAALVLFDQPLDLTHRLLSQTERQHEYLPELKTAERIRQEGSAVINEHRVRVMFIGLTYRIRTESDFDSGRIWWVLDPTHDNDLDVLEGYWELYEMSDSRTLGRFKTRVVLGPALPAFLQNAATRRNVPRVVERMRRWVNSEGTYRP